MIIGLSGCNFADSRGSDSSSTSSTQARRGELKTDISAESERDLARPPGSGEGFSVNPVALNTNSSQGEMQPARGLNTKRLFAESLRDDSARFERLEGAVQTIRDELDKLGPSINRLVAVEEDIQELVSQLNTLVRGEGQTGQQEDEISVSQLQNTPDAINRAMGAEDAAGAAGTATAGFTEGAEQNGMEGTPQPSPSSTPAANNQPLQIAPPPPPMAEAAPAGQSPPPAPPEPGPGGVAENRTGTPQYPPAAPVRPPAAPERGPPPLPAEATDAPSGQPRLTNIRMADNAGKTRIVMEAGGPMTYSADLDNSENILTLIFPAGSSIDPSSLPIRSTLVKSVTYTPQGNGGFVLAFTLTHGSKILNQGSIAPNADNPRHRLYIDLSN